MYFWSLFPCSKRIRFRCKEEVYWWKQPDLFRGVRGKELPGESTFPAGLLTQASMSRTWKFILPQVPIKQQHFPCGHVLANILKATLYKISWKHGGTKLASPLPTPVLPHFLCFLWLACLIHQTTTKLLAIKWLKINLYSHRALGFC